MTTARLPELNNGIVTSWLPFTTPAPAPTPYPSSCNSAFRLETLSGSVTNLVAYDPWYGQAIDTNYRGCLAPEQTQWWAQEKMPTTMFNLGPFACPTPYTTATTSSVGPGTTMVACCPSNYAYQGSILPPLSGRQCLSMLSSGQIITAKTGSIGMNIFTDTTATITATDVGIYGNQLNGFIFGDAVATASSTGSTHQASSSAATTTPPTTATAAATGIAGSSTNSSASSMPVRSSSSSILSTTAGKVGVYVGVPLAVIALFSFIGMLLLYRRRTAKSKFVELESTSPRFVVPGPPPRPPHPPQELWSPVEEKGKRFEIETNEKPVEMWAGRNSR